ncbi:transcription antitermination protein NusB [Corynebacterium jeikeium]|jgi:transcription antitermination protein NusB|uniref:Transcription antitermination protein NusB n=1 Tax=Corynebacterium jeikeium (strain K411) TaxID=306537 RepID=NUSB_CORJK|nr:transcription antitermination factor NusB [Corynebacterium jeikeium]Q4JVG6.1 RecName: Full=Transcription antitermination protein NusB; AltName: Full=Antitermination factor NusB [Corynebacterium jeikeium K411]CAI37191.1 N utilization substance protein B [Corynebacterium jeikeium K411]SUY85453.1 transcription antitermination protein NusB [Corynebacterium jeikeium]
MTEERTADNKAAKAASFKRHGSRYKARRRAVDILFEAEFRDIDPVEIVEERISLAKDSANQVKPVPEYTQQIVPGVATNLDALDEAIALHLSSDWQLDRLPAVDRAVLRVAAWELKFNDDVPPQVAVVEGVELASEYSHDKAPSYIHAVLDGINKDLQLQADLKIADASAAKRAEQAEQPGQAESDELDGLLDGVVQESDEA